MAVPTPCIRLCVLDDEGRLCLGCGRTLAEIGAWSALSDSERRAVMADLPRRLALSQGPDTGAANDRSTQAPVDQLP